MAYDDFREVEGLTLPFRLQYSYAMELIGDIVVTFETVETGVETDVDDAGRLQRPRGP